MDTGEVQRPHSSDGNSRLAISRAHWALAAGAAAIFLVAGLLVGFLVWRDPPPLPTAAQVDPVAEMPTRTVRAVATCEGELQCDVSGLAGTCIRGVCVLGDGQCSRDIDCDDSVSCTVNRCEGGTCVANDRAGDCKLKDSGVGACAAGYCEPVSSIPCDLAKDCPSSPNPCKVASCVDHVCAITPQDAETSCRLRGGAPGACTEGECRIDLEAASGSRKCRKSYDEYYGRYIQTCRGSTAYVLTDEKREKAERGLERAISKDLRYDMAVRLVALPDGGYNIVTYNNRGRDDVRGLCDPSLVAFTSAPYTARTKWKSRALHVWLRPLDEGWGIKTSGSRKAIRKGRAASRLGVLGVVDIEAFRTWLERGFRPLRVMPGERLGPAASSGGSR